MAKPMKWSFIATLVITLLAFSAGEAFACDCAGTLVPCQAYGEASAVFVGTVINSRIITIKQSDYEAQRRVVRFSIDTPFRGVEDAEVEVSTGLGGGDCGFGFVQTQQYLVYAYEYEGKLSTSICTRTRSISKAEDDLSYIRGLARAKPGVVIRGEVVRYRRNEQGNLDNLPLTGITVTIEGQTRKTTETDAKGQYVVEGLPAGDYVVKVSLPEGLSTRGEPEQKVNVADRGCAVVGFWLEPDGRLSGRVLNPQGLPVNKAEVFLIEFDKERYRGHWAAAYSDEEGRYAFKRIPPGRYVLSIRFDGMTSQNRPFPMIYYPGVSDRAQAKVITVGEGQKIADYNLEMPPLPLEHEVAGSVVWSNGKPAVGARVGYIVVGDAVFYGTKDDGGANFSLKAYEGLRLTMRASIEPEKGKYVYSDWVEVTVTPGLPSVKIILPQP